MRKIICDRCGNDIKDDTYIGLTYFTGSRLAELIPELKGPDESDRRFELCGSCVRGAYKYITRYEKAEQGKIEVA